MKSERAATSPLMKRKPTENFLLTRIVSKHKLSDNDKHMNRTALLSLAAGVTLMTVPSCSFGPAWQRPEMPVPEAFRNSAASVDNMSDLPWQEVLHDGQLQALLNDVLENNRSLEAMQHNVNAARHYVTMAAAPLFPWFGYGAGSTKGMNSSGGASIVHTTSTTTNPGSMQLSASWELDVWGKTRKGIEAAIADADGAEASLADLRLSLMKQVACGYLQLIMLDEQLRIAHESVASYRESLELFQNQLEGGVADKLQTSSAQAALAAAEAQVPALESQIIALENTLSALAGRAPGSIRRGSDLMAFAEASTVAPGIPASVLARRPDIRAKEFALRAANADIGAAIASYFPSISLTGAAGYATADLRHAQFGKHSGWGIGANLTGPLFQAGQLRANELMKREAFLTAKADYENSVFNALSEISTTLTERQKLRAIMQKQEEAVAAYQESVKLSKARYQQGLAGYYEVLDAQKSLFPAQTQLAAYRYQYAACIPTLYTQLGGGWQQP